MALGRVISLTRKFMNTELENIETEITELQEKKGILDRASWEASEKIRNLKLRNAEIVYGIKLGSIVTVKGVEFQVGEINISTFRGKPWAKGFPKKKNGVYSQKLQNLYSDWEVVK